VLIEYHVLNGERMIALYGGQSIPEEKRLSLMGLVCMPCMMTSKRQSDTSFTNIEDLQTEVDSAKRNLRNQFLLKYHLGTVKISSSEIDV